MDEAKVKKLNVFLLGLAFMLVFTAFQTMGNVQTTILESAANKTSSGYVDGFTGSGYTSLAIIYLVFSLANWFGPPVVAFAGPKLTLFGGGLTYALFIGQLMRPINWLLYGASAVVGLGAALIWIAQGNFLTMNSDPETMGRNTGIFWAMYQSSLLIGNTFVFFQFRDLTDIDSHTRTFVTSVLLALCLAGVVVFLFLRPAPRPESNSEPQQRQGVLAIVADSFRLAVTTDMVLLIVTFCFTGFSLTFWSGVYGKCVGSTKKFGEDAKSLVGLHGIVVGAGEIVGGLVFGIFGRSINRYGRDWPVMLGFVLNMAAYAAALFNLPADSPFHDTDSDAYISSNPYLAVAASFFMGLGDGCFNTQIISILGSLYADNSAAAFAIYKFAQSATAAIAFFYTLHITLPYQLLVLAVFCSAGTLTFCHVERKVKRSAASLNVAAADDTTESADNVLIEQHNDRPESEAPVC